MIRCKYVVWKVYLHDSSHQRDYTQRDHQAKALHIHVLVRQRIALIVQTTYFRGLAYQLVFAWTII
jgi:hypothetical protein